MPSNKLLVLSELSVISFKHSFAQSVFIKLLVSASNGVRCYGNDRDKRRHSLVLPHLESGGWSPPHPADTFGDAVSAVIGGGQGCYRRTQSSAHSLAGCGLRKSFLTR